jgi:hypothetical protein
MVDNMLAAHARDPYEEPRRIVVAMAEMYQLDGAGRVVEVDVEKARAATLASTGEPSDA